MPLKDPDKLREYRRAYELKRQHRRRDAAIEQLGGECVWCGATHELEFDHIDPSTKTFTIGKSWSRAALVIDAELAKCQLLCGICHREKTRSEQTGPHGTWGRYRHGPCRCDECVRFVNSRLREIKAKTRERLKQEDRSLVG